ncbi:MAG TPA: type III-A CRISPR-associated RAMP protein Csm4 [Bacteroidales bacterium]|nr:type III-A CRISPR-associated RAMP protein Csm4 [Bacteroidales bacterium]HQI45662.1 type III-A CRISPR-associated RAMP protein Csm4 [Bacteroidales bacterium]
MLKAIKLRFVTPVHFGRGREELDKTELVYHSDSLKSALYAIGLPLFEDWKNENNFFSTFRISSCFPFAKNEFFLPKPQLKREINFGGTSDDKTAKKVKKIEYFEKSIFEEYINNTNGKFEINQAHISPEGAFVCNDENTFTHTNNNGIKSKYSFYKTEVQQRVAVPNEWELEESKPFYIDRIYFEKECGLYFLAEFDNSLIEEQVLKSFRLLGENGIGTDRTVGNGLFEFDNHKDVIDFHLNIPNSKGLSLSLGLYLPTEEEHASIAFDKSAWSLLKRGGYMAGSESEEFRHLRKKSIYMFGEGSVFESAKTLNGKYENLAPVWNNEKMHPVWRDGQCLMIKI